MKPKRHQKMRMHFAASLVVCAAVQIARQTSQLHNVARATSERMGAFILAPATAMTNMLFECSIAPPPPQTKIKASAAQPTRLPIQDVAQAEASSPMPMRLRKNPCV